jgi:putative transposase
MPRKSYRPEDIIAKLREADVLLGQGKTYHRWRQEYGGLSAPQARRLKELERENARLRKAVADLTLDKMILQEAGRGN